MLAVCIVIYHEQEKVESLTAKKIQKLTEDSINACTKHKSEQRNN